MPLKITNQAYSKVTEAVSGESFGGCVRCDFVVSVVLHAFGYSSSPLKIDATYKQTEKNMKKHDF